MTRNRDKFGEFVPKRERERERERESERERDAHSLACARRSFVLESSRSHAMFRGGR